MDRLALVFIFVFGIINAQEAICAVAPEEGGLTTNASSVFVSDGFADVRDPILHDDGIGERLGINFHDVNLSHTQARSVRGNKFLGGKINAGSRERGLLIGGEPQRHCECSNDERGHSRKKPVMRIDETRRADGMTDEESDYLALFLGTFGGLLGACLFYAAAKRVTDKIFGKEK